jgi:hypothetical protein
MRTASSACAVRDCTLHAARHAVARGLQQCRRGEPSRLSGGWVDWVDWEAGNGSGSPRKSGRGRACRGNA